MRKVDRGGNLLFLFTKFLLITLLCGGLFFLVGIRSSVITMEYRLGELERQKALYLKERKILLAERATLLSLKNVKESVNSNYNFVFPDRVRVIHIKKKDKGAVPYRVSTASVGRGLEGRRLAEP